MDSQDEDFAEQSKSKIPIVRGARACTVCRAAKMKCVGAEDGQKPCQRCKRANTNCVFEKHRRGRKPGSKLSEASKMLRRLEKGLSSAKLKSQATEASASSAYSPSDSRPGGSQDYATMSRTSDRAYSPAFPSTVLPPLAMSSYQQQNDDNYPASSNGSRSNMDMDEDEDDREYNDETLFPVKLIRKENQRNSFFRTILNPEQEPSGTSGRSRPAAPRNTATVNGGLADPITSGIIDEDDAKVLFDLIFLRLNPFINLFDPALHTVNYIRSKCPFLFTTLIMAGCKFFKPDLFKACQKLANEFAVRAFAEGWKRVEVVQAFACLTYWKDPDDNRTWTFIGYACRLAVELGMNRHVPHPPPHETEFQKLERRNRERTYFVLFVHDRSLSMQTGRHWMLPEDDLVRHSVTWHEEGGPSIRPEDVIVAAFVQLRRVAAETTDMFYTSKGSSSASHNDVNYEVVLRSCNGKLTQWMDTWDREMQRAGGETFHFSFLSFFRLYVRLFLNSFGIQASMTPSSRASPSLQALSVCLTSALDMLKIVSKDFASMSMLRYGQESTTTMSAYAAVFLLKLLRSSNTVTEIQEGTTQEIHSLISKTADAYYDASVLSPASTAAAYHARFLRSLVANDLFKTRKTDQDRHETTPIIDPRLQQGSHVKIQPPAPQIYPTHAQTHEQSYHFPSNSPTLSENSRSSPQQRHHSFPEPPVRGIQGTYPGYGTTILNVPQHASEQDAQYWHNMFVQIGFPENFDQIQSAPQPQPPAQAGQISDVRSAPHYSAYNSGGQYQPEYQGSSQSQSQASLYSQTAGQAGYRH